GALAVGRDPPPPLLLASIIDGEDDVGVAGVDREQHGSGLSGCPGCPGKEDIAGGNAAQRAVVTPQQQRAVPVEAVEDAVEGLVGQTDPDRSADAPGVAEPCLAHRSEAGFLPAAEPAVER